MTEQLPLTTFSDIEAAARRIKGQAVRTPLLHYPVLDEVSGGRVFVLATELFEQATTNTNWRACCLATMPW